MEYSSTSSSSTSSSSSSSSDTLSVTTTATPSSSTSSSSGSDSASPSLLRSRSSHSSRSPTGVGVRVDHVTVTDGKDKTILDDVSFEVEGGSTTVIVGPPGVGKSVLLSMVAGQVSEGLEVSRGRVEYGGEELGEKEVQAQVGFVVQNDLMLSCATPAETLETIAALALPELGKSGRDSRVDDVLASLRMTHVADTLVGVPGLKRGLSGGERKRANIGRSLVVQPHVLVVDSPTDGLDTPTALEVLDVLHRVAREKGVTVIVTLSQPSTAMIMPFDHLLALAPGGKLAYRGGPATVLPHFAALGFEIPRGVNPAELIVDVLSADEDDLDCDDDSEADAVALEGGMQTLAGRILTLVAAVPPLPKVAMGSGLGRGFESDSGRELGASRASPLKSFQILLARNVRTLVRAREALVMRMAQAAFLGVLLGVLYFQMSRGENGGRDRMGFILIISIMPLFSGLEASVSTFMPERAVFLRESRERLYGVISYGLAKMIADLPIQLVATLLLAIPAYTLSGLRLEVDAITVFLLTSTGLSLIGSWLGLFLSTLVDDEATANVLATLFVLPGFLFVGVLPRFANIPSALKWMKWTSFLRPGFQALITSELEGMTLSAPSSCVSSGGNTTLPCPPLTGNDFLDSIGARDDGSVTVNVVVVFAFVAFFGLAFLGGLGWVRHKHK